MTLQSQNTTSKLKRLRIWAWSTIVTLLIILGLWVPHLIFDADTGTLLLDGSSADRKYELGTTTTLNCTVTDGGGNACITIDHPLGNKTCDSDSSFVWEWSTSYVNHNLDTSGVRNRNISFAGLQTHVLNVSQHAQDEMLVASIGLYGHETVGSYPYNITVTMGNASQIDWAFTGFLDNTTLIQNFTSKNTSSQTLTFLQAGADVVYFQLAKGITVTSASASFSGSSNQESLDFTDGFDNQTYLNVTGNMARDNTNNLMFTNHSDLAEKNYTMTSAKLYNPTKNVASVILSWEDNAYGYYLDVYGNCSNAVSVSDSNHGWDYTVTQRNDSVWTFWSESDDSFWENRMNVLLGVFKDNHASSQAGPYVCTSVTKVVTHYASDQGKDLYTVFLKDVHFGRSTGTVSYLYELPNATSAELLFSRYFYTSASSWGADSSNYAVQSPSGTNLFYSVNPYDTWGADYDTSINQNEPWYDVNLSEGFKLVSYYYCGNCNLVATSKIERLTAVLVTDASSVNRTTTGSATWYNCGTSGGRAACQNVSTKVDLAAPSAGNFQEPMRRADYYVSGNYGTNWTAAVNGTEVSLDVIGTQLVWKVEINHSTNVTNETRIYNVTVEVDDSVCSSVWLDVAGDGLGIYDSVTEFNGTYTWSMNVSEFNTEVDVSDNLMPLVSLYVSCFSNGALTVNNISILGDLTNPLEVNMANTTEPYLLTRTGSTSVPINITAHNGTLQVNYTFNYKGSGNVSVVCSNKTGGGSTDTQVIQYRYSSFNVTLPKGIDYVDYYSTTANSRAVQAEGQIYHSNGTCETPIYNITSTAYDDAFQLYVEFNESIESCINVTFDNDCTQAGGIIVNSSWQELDSSVATGATTNIYSWADLYSCTASSALLVPWNFTARCVDCVEVW